MKLLNKSNLRLISVLLRNAFFGINLSCLRFLLKPKKLTIYNQACMELWGIHSNYGLPSVSLADFLNCNNQISLRLYAFDLSTFLISSAHVKDRLIFFTIAKVLNAKSVFEIGTFRGASAAGFALNTPENAKIYTLDLPIEIETPIEESSNTMDRKIIKSRTTYNYIYENLEEGSKVIQLYGNSFNFDFSPYYNSIDLFLIDGAHNFSAVSNDTEIALRCVKENGIIMWHDYGRFGINEVSKFIHSLRKKGYEIQRIIGSHVAVLRK